MGWATGLAIYFVIWWIVVFAVLPWGVRPVEPGDVAKGHASGAPRKPRMLIKIVVTTVVAAGIWLVVYYVIQSGTISFRE